MRTAHGSGEKIALVAGKNDVEIATAIIDRATLDPAPMSLIARQLRTSIRSLARAPIVSTSIIATLAVSIGATTAMFSVINAVLIRGLPFRDADRVVWITSVTPDRADGPFTLPEFIDFRERARGVDLAAYASWSTTLATTDVPQRLQGMRLSADAFDILGVPPSAGRLLRESDDAIDAPRVVVVSYGFWQTRLAGKREAVGQVLRLNGDAHTIVGVLPKHFPLPMRTVDVVVPLSPDRDPRRRNRGSTNFLRLFGRVRDASSIAGAERELSDLTKDLREEFPGVYESKIGVRVAPMQQALIGDHRATLLVLGGAVSLLLCIALANVINLLLIRAATHQGEIAVRRALGATASQVSWHLFAEGAVLAVAGALGGIALAYAGVGLVVRNASTAVPRLGEVQVDGETLLFVVALTVVATIVFSALPVVAALKTSPESALRASSRANVGSRAQARLRGTFIVAEIALTVVVTTATASLVASLERLQHVELGYRPDSVFTIRLAFPPSRYADAAQLARFYNGLHSALMSQPGVVSAGVVNAVPLSGVLATANIAAAGQAPASIRDWPDSHYREVSADYFKTIGARMLAGRAFRDADNESSMPAVIVNRAVAERLFPGTNPIGRALLVDDNSKAPREVVVVGVVENMRDVDLDGQTAFVVFIPLAQTPRDIVSFVAASQFWAVRVAMDPSRFAPTFLAALKQTDADVATSSAGTLRGFIDATLATRRFTVSLLIAFAVISLSLATIGVYGVIAYGVEQQRREIGVRLTLGASPRSIVRDVLGNALVLSGVGVAIGVGGAMVAGRSMASLLFGVAPGEPVLLLAVSALAVFATGLASWIPAMRASRIDPLAALSS
jgi:putative ABC transport system permease protein